MCCTSFHTLSLCLTHLYNSFSPSFVSKVAYKSSYTCAFTITTAFFALLFFVDLFIIFISYFVPCFLCLFLFFHALLYSSFHHHVSCLLFVSQMSLLAQFQLFFLAILLFCSTCQVIHPCLPKSWLPPV